MIYSTTQTAKSADTTTADRLQNHYQLSFTIIAETLVIHLLYANLYTKSNQHNPCLRSVLHLVNVQMNYVTTFTWWHQSTKPAIALPSNSNYWLLTVKSPFQSAQTHMQRNTISNTSVLCVIRGSCMQYIFFGPLTLKHD